MTATTDWKISLGQIEDIPFSHLTDKPTTLAGYGITDAYTKTEIDNMIGAGTLQAVTDNGNTTTNSVTVNGIVNNSSYVQNAWGWTMNGRNWVLNFDNNTHSSTAFIIQNTSSPNPGGMRMTQRGSTIIRARGDSVTDYYILRLQGSSHSQATVFDVANSGVTKIGLAADLPTYGLLRVGGGASFDSTIRHSKALLSNESMTLGQYLTDSHVVTGLKKYRRGVSGTTVETQSWEYPDNNGETYNLRLFNNSVNNNVRWFFNQKMTVGTNQVDLDWPVLGFRNGVTIIGAEKYPDSITGIETFYDGQTDPSDRFKMSMYTEGDTLMKDNLIVGQQDYTNTSFLEAVGKFIKSTGVVYAQEGFRTANPDNPGGDLDHTTWLLGELSVNSQTESTHTLRASIDGVLVDILVRAV